MYLTWVVSCVDDFKKQNKLSDYLIIDKHHSIMVYVFVWLVNWDVIIANSALK